ncbi:hypothetical protein B566_EDAN009772 [Ephemera danica]|nr:hypothetical protein B566_EDAN009772 [Ephemera danica]
MVLKIVLVLAFVAVYDSRSWETKPHYESGSDIHADFAKLARNSNEDARETPSGSYSFIGADGQTYTITIYEVENNGLLTKYSLLPTPPLVPEAIARSVENARTFRAKGFYPYIEPKDQTFTKIADNEDITNRDHLPTPPPVPAAISRSMENARTYRAKGFYYPYEPKDQTYTKIADKNEDITNRDHLPTPPPVPAAIARSMENARTYRAKGFYYPYEPKGQTYTFTTYGVDTNRFLPTPPRSMENARTYRAKGFYYPYEPKGQTYTFTTYGVDTNRFLPTPPPIPVENARTFRAKP